MKGPLSTGLLPETRGRIIARLNTRDLTRKPLTGVVENEKGKKKKEKDSPQRENPDRGSSKAAEGFSRENSTSHRKGGVKGKKRALFRDPRRRRKKGREKREEGG